ncbi:MAG: lysylphosphatidylglycerol synthase domain-containing protein, partial [Planctomycetota bacterium]|nr:lysylphosphatidylglycerol synthase domain-containing protein [Planctomycetota bacterium]
MKVFLSLAVALVALALLFAWGGVDAGDVLGTLAAADLRLVALAFLIQGLIYVFRAIRLRVLLLGAGGADVSIPGLTAASAAWILDSHILPAKVGEASLVLHLSRVGVRAE